MAKPDSGLRRSKTRTFAKPTYQLLEERNLLAAYVPGELLIQFESTEELAARQLVRDAIGGTLTETIHTNSMIHSGAGVLERIQLSRGTSVESAIAAAQLLPGVQFAEPNWIYSTQAVSNDPYYLRTTGNLWGMYSSDTPVAIGPTNTTNTYGSQAEKAWGNNFTGSNSVYVGIVDTGVQYTHPDLAPNMWTNPFDPIDGIDNDGNGRIDDRYGWDFNGNNNSVYDGTSDDHGTHTSGTVGAKGGNALGVAGVNWNVTMIPTKFLGPSGGTTTAAIQALDYLTDLKTRHGLNIVATNNSWGGGGYSASLLAAITRGAQQGILFIAAAGNSASNNDTTASYPSNYNTTSGAGYDAVIAVASITSTGGRSSFSSYGATTVDLGAPGSGIYSTYPSNTYGAMSGTSMATPHVTGAAALYKAHNPSATAQQIRAAILNNTTATTSMTGITVTGGRLDIAKMMNSVNPFPNVTINNVSKAEGNSGSSNAVFTVTLSASSAYTITVAYATSNGTATAGSDYTTTSGTLTFSPGQTSKTISVPVLGDTTIESNETFNVNLSNATLANITDNLGVGTITNDDTTSLPDLSINDVTVTEGTGGTTSAIFTVSLSAAATQVITVNYATANGTADGTDFTPGSGTLTFAVGDSTKTITVLINGDSSVESDETYSVNLSGAVNANILDGSGLGTILNDDTAVIPTISINDVSQNEGNSGTTAFSFVVTLSQATTNSVSVSYATANGSATAGSDYSAASGTLTFAAGEVSKTVVVNVNGDTGVESSEDFFVNLSSPVNGTISDGSGLGTILNDDSAIIPNITISDVSLNEGNAGTTAFVFTISLSQATTNSVSVDFATANGSATAGSDYTSVSGNVVFAPGETTKTVTVNVAGDTSVEGDEGFSVGLSNASNGTIVDSTGDGTILNDDSAVTPFVTITNVRRNEGTGANTVFSFVVKLSVATTVPVSVNYTTVDVSASAGSDYDAVSGTLTIPAGVTTGTINVTVIGDSNVEGQEMFSVMLSDVVNGTLLDPEGTGTIVNDDTGEFIPPSGSKGSGDKPPAPFSFDPSDPDQLEPVGLPIIRVPTRLNPPQVASVRGELLSLTAWRDRLFASQIDDAIGWGDFDEAIELDAE